MTGGNDQWACDTSFAVAALDPNHEAHGPCRRALVDLRPALSGHAAFETYAILTRMPVPLRLTATQAGDVLARAFPSGCWLSVDDQDALVAHLAAAGLAGGSVYDALVGRAAQVNGRSLLTRDRRAERTYRAIGVDHRFVD